MINGMLIRLCYATMLSNLRSVLLIFTYYAQEYAIILNRKPEKLSHIATNTVQMVNNY